MDQICTKRAFRIENKKGEHRHWIPHIRISVVIEFHLKLTILTIWTKFAQKGHSRSKTKKVNSIIEFWTFELGQPPNFNLNWSSWFFELNLSKKGISGRKRKSLGIKFQLKLIILTFETKFTQKGHFSLKAKKVITAIEFCIFALG